MPKLLDVQPPAIDLYFDGPLYACAVRQLCIGKAICDNSISIFSSANALDKPEMFSTD